MNRKSLFYILFFAVLFLAFYFMLTRIIPGFGNVKMPVLSYVQPFFFKDQDGRLITNKDVAGNFFTTCKGICPKMNNNLKLVYYQFRDEPDFLILSHSVDPETDSVGRMKIYADSLQVDSRRWIFLTGRKDSLYHAARVSYLLDDPKNELASKESQFIH